MPRSGIIKCNTMYWDIFCVTSYLNFTIHIYIYIFSTECILSVFTVRRTGFLVLEKIQSNVPAFDLRQHKPVKVCTIHKYVHNIRVECV